MKWIDTRKSSDSNILSSPLYTHFAVFILHTFQTPVYKTFQNVHCTHASDSVMISHISHYSTCTFSLIILCTFQEINRTIDTLSQFLHQLRDNQLLCRLFKFVMVTSREEAFQQLTEVLGVQEAQSQQQLAQEAGPDVGKTRPPLGEHSLVMGQTDRHCWQGVLVSKVLPKAGCCIVQESVSSHASPTMGLCQGL